MEDLTDLDKFLMDYRVGRKNKEEEELMYYAVCALITIVEKQQKEIDFLKRNIIVKEPLWSINFVSENLKIL